MAITSVGYDGTVDEVQWANMVSKTGFSEYGVDSSTAFLVTQVAGTRMVSIAAGLAWGRGVMDISDTAVNVQLEAVTTGSRYDLIALRRSWGPANGGPSEIVIIKGTSSKALPSMRQSNPGVVDDQPIALVRVQAGSTSIPEIIDLRVWARNGGLYAVDDLARSYIASVGTEIVVKNNLWRRIVGANNTASWLNCGPVNNIDWVSTTSGGASGWKIEFIRYKIRNGVCELQVSAERTGAAIPPNSTGNIDNQKICNVPALARPASLWRPLTSGPTGRVASGSITASGDVYFNATTPANFAKGDKIQLAGSYLLD